MATPGTVIGGRFRVEQVLGAGGMGVVLAATHLQLGHRVAIKLLREDMARVPTVVQRFLREARAAVQLRTEHVCRVFDVGSTDLGEPYMVMELLEGSDLGRAIAGRPLPVTIAVEYVLQACVAIAEAHAAGIIHRDLKPANLIVTRRPGGAPLVKVLDFGIAKALAERGVALTQSQSMLGSPAYISPEQLQSARDVDARTDLWSLGATLYQLVSGRLPFHAQTAAGMAVRIMTQPPDPLDVDPALRAVILRCLEKSPAQRHADVAALAADLAPFGGPSGRAIAGAVQQLLHGTLAAPPSVSAFAATAAPAVHGAATGWPATPAPSIAPSTIGAVSAPRAAAVAVDLADRTRHRPWWLLAPLVVLVCAGTAVICSRRDAPSGTAGPVAAVTTDEAVAAAIDAGAAPSPPAPVDVDPLPLPGSRPGVLEPARTVVREPRPRSAHPVAAAAAREDAAKDAAVHTPGHDAKPTVVGSVAGTAREAKNTCLESAADTPFNTAMCWCAKKDKARAQAAYARLSGFKRTSVRTWCAARGVELSP